MRNEVLGKNPNCESKLPRIEIRNPMFWGLTRHSDDEKRCRFSPAPGPTPVARTKRCHVRRPKKHVSKTSLQTSIKSRKHKTCHKIKAIKSLCSLCSPRLKLADIWRHSPEKAAPVPCSNASNNILYISLSMLLNVCHRFMFLSFFKIVKLKLWIVCVVFEKLRTLLNVVVGRLFWLWHGGTGKIGMGKCDISKRKSAEKTRLAEWWFNAQTSRLDSCRSASNSQQVDDVFLESNNLFLCFPLPF